MSIQEIDAAAIATDWLNHFGHGFSSADVSAITSCFLPDGWLRDILVFTWDTRSLEGHEKITNYLHPAFYSAEISDLKLTNRTGLWPVAQNIAPNEYKVSAGFTFSSAIAYGQGYVQLLPDAPSRSWKALSVLMAVVDLRGHEEIQNELGIYGGHTLTWEDVFTGRQAQIEQEPLVLILGGGQSGLNVAARFKQMNIPAVVIERDNRIGDSWRRRYPTLTLHTPKKHAGSNQVLYHDFPSNWPTYTPKGKLANWLEQYAAFQDLIVWTNSVILPTPTYDARTGKWTVTVNKNGILTTLHPAHIVLATGVLASPYMPPIPELDHFTGTVLHSTAYPGGKAFAGKRVLVVGAGNTSADICQDLHIQGAQSITMLQRSHTCVMPITATRANLDAIWPENEPTDVCDLRFAGMPLGLLRRLARAKEQETWEVHKEMYDGLRKAGMKLSMGKDGSGHLLMVFERLGGKCYYVDVGCTDLIISSKVKIKHGVEIARFMEDGVVFMDGTTLEADVVIFATGYTNVRNEMKSIFGAETMEKTSEVWGLDEEDEMRGNYRPSGHPGLWYAAGDFQIARFYSKPLAIMIKAITLGLWDGKQSASTLFKKDKP